ncbi:MAG: hypothetical protein ACM31P_09050 [Actinomycetota bacterium]
MSMIDDIKKGSLTTMALGAGVLSLLPALLPVAARGVRPLLSSAIQGGLVCLEKGQEAVAEIHRILDHVAAESEAASYGTSSAMGGGYHGASSGATAEPWSPGSARPMAESAPIMTRNGEPDPEVMG